MIAITTISWSFVNPRIQWSPDRVARPQFAVLSTARGLADSTITAHLLPVSIFCVIHCDALRQGIDVEDILAAPGRRGRVI